MEKIVRYYVWLRCLVFGGQILGISVIAVALDADIPWLWVILIVFGICVATAKVALFSSLEERLLPNSLTRHLLLDVAALFALVYLTGGSMNPFVSLFVLPILFAAATLSLRRTALIAVLAVTAYTVLMFFHLPIAAHHSSGNATLLHLWGMWFGFVLAAVCISSLVARVANEIRVRDRELAHAREAALKADRIVALGALAAGTAHELGTPLSTIAVLANDLEQETAHEETRARLQVINKTIARCKTILSRLAADTGQVQADSGRTVMVNDYLTYIIEDWRSIRPGVDVSLEISGSSPSPTILADRTLDQAIVNILNNAADASTSVVDVVGSWSQDEIKLSVIDDGVGIDHDIMSKLGEQTFSSKPIDQGMGIGLYLATSALRRIGGTVEFNLNPNGGTAASIIIPLTALKV